MTNDLEELKKLLSDVADALECDPPLMRLAHYEIEARLLAAINALPSLIERVERAEAALEESADGFQQIADHYDRLMAGMPEPSMRNSAECIARYQVYVPEFKSIAESYHENAIADINGDDDAH